MTSAGERTATEGAGARVPPSRSARRWRIAGLAALATFAVWFLLANRADIPSALRAVQHADPGWLAAAVAASAAYVVVLAILHAAAQRAARLRTSPLRLLPVTVAANAMNLVTKSAGMAGLPLFLGDARRRELPGGAVTAAYVLAMVLAEVAFAFALAAAIVVLVLGGQLTVAEAVAAVVFGVYLIGRVALFVLTFGDRERLQRLVAWPRRQWHRLRRRPDHAKRPTVRSQAADEIADAVALLRARPGAAIPAFAHALALEVIGVLMLAAVLRAVGAPASPTVALVGYAVSVLFAIVGVLPSGLGFVEVSLTAVLVAYGAPVATAAAAVALYRVCELWLPAMAGVLVARRLRRA